MGNYWQTFKQRLPQRFQMNLILDRVYNWSPEFVQNIGVSFYGLQLYRREYGRAFKRKLAEFEKLQWLTRTEIEEFQNESLRGLISHCYDNVQYYRQVMEANKLTPRDIQMVSDLPKLPILTKDGVRQNSSTLVAGNYRPSQLIHGHTSGTTGSPLKFCYDKQVCLIKNVIDWRQKRWGGVNPGDRMAFFLGRAIVPIERKKPSFWRHNWILNHLFMSSFHLSGENVGHYIDKLERYKPVAVEGYPSSMYIIAKLLLSRGKTLPVKAVFTSSETLFEHQREAIEQAFACNLFDFYGSAERVMFATECDRHNGHHVNSDFGITEILKKDNEHSSPGELGRIIATGLHNYAMPLVRYDTGDVSGLKANMCTCGRGFPLMEDVTTKNEDIITTRDGRLISSSILTHPFKPMERIAEAQIVQEDREHVYVNVVKRPGYSDYDSLHLLRELRRRLGDGMKVEIVFVDEIPRTKAGKFRFVVSKVPLEF